MTQKEALDILKMGHNVFLTGSPGSGKTHTINEYVTYLRSHGIEPAITASTGISATHIGGATIHSWSGIGIKKNLEKRDLQKIASTGYITKRIKRAKTLIIDEISMLSPQTFSMVDMVCREIKDNTKPFGGLQIVVVGDFFQLPPIVKKEEIKETQMALIEEYSGRFAYDSSVWEKAKLTICYLTEQHRQDDKNFLSVLSAIRSDEFGDAHLQQIEARKISSESAPKNAPKLFSYNIDVDRVNNEILDHLAGESKVFSMFSHGPTPLVAFLKKGCLSPEALSLKVGASVMFTKNNQKEGFVNGTLGTVEKFEEYTQEPLVKIRNGRIIKVGVMDWNLEENGKSRAKITQLPLRLAWAITVHKSQGMSLDEAVMDLSNVFEYGQGYVALSRVRRFSGLHLLGWNKHAFMVHPDVLEKDAQFQNQSEKAIGELGIMSVNDIKKISEQFILACDGKLPQNEAEIRGSVGAYSVKKISQDARRNLPKQIRPVSEKHTNAYMPWNEEQDIKLEELFTKDLNIGELAIAFNRTKGAIISRLKKLGILEV